MWFWEFKSVFFFCVNGWIVGRVRFIYGKYISSTLNLLVMYFDGACYMPLIYCIYTVDN
jgi:hypothetical protein